MHWQAGCLRRTSCQHRSTSLFAAFCVSGKSSVRSKKMAEYLNLFLRFLSEWLQYNWLSSELFSSRQYWLGQIQCARELATLENLCLFLIFLYSELQRPSARSRKTLCLLNGAGKVVLVRSQIIAGDYKIFTRILQ